MINISGQGTLASEDLLLKPGKENQSPPLQEQQASSWGDSWIGSPRHCLGWGYQEEEECREWPQPHAGRPREQKDSCMWQETCSHTSDRERQMHVPSMGGDWEQWEDPSSPKIAPSLWAPQFKKQLLPMSPSYTHTHRATTNLSLSLTQTHEPSAMYLESVLSTTASTPWDKLYYFHCTD